MSDLNELLDGLIISIKTIKERTNTLKMMNRKKAQILSIIERDNPKILKEATLKHLEEEKIEKPQAYSPGRLIKWTGMFMNKSKEK